MFRVQEAQHITNIERTMKELGNVPNEPPGRLADVSHSDDLPVGERSRPLSAHMSLYAAEAISWELSSLERR